VHSGGYTQRVIPQAPRVKLFGKVPKAAFDFLNFDEAERLVAAADLEWRPVLLVALKAGLRLGELIGLQWDRPGLAAEHPPRSPDYLARGGGLAEGRA
jgi:integrase